ncbi:hypothetical protein PSJM300_10415 [Stutzerimonas stutzeri DSM 10701]|uniref:DUF736 domain-containing protein n=1 Tax=Stutzerimonas nitrititolerans TaxID=2482751 RepID=A0AA42BBE2_9GAMM|nr:DUF736 domain-containing protein [Stutzerimonas nitrititolerans]AFN78149.1 hypothetical protein PSJM300_10415 [Stutzerimonas stutzeri DSM 10701]KRW65236.1 hypothetical protein AO735_09075 [Pseudomonas sp. TTU2014-096BSC]MBA1233542.1 DUF736 domain-containing protein [Stutzerimonas stutzeri]MCO7543236.1 DUF736 domain-containing protein [Stutzerimonas nitrititolerans]
MANIGSFTTLDDGFTGTLRTLTLQKTKVAIVPNDKSSPNAPDYRILTADGYEIGAAWKKLSQAERPYLSVSLDDPAFQATVYARLVENDDGTHTLLWSRSKAE